jgi:hypothetical protein
MTYITRKDYKKKKKTERLGTKTADGTIKGVIQIIILKYLPIYLFVRYIQCSINIHDAVFICVV